MKNNLILFGAGGHCKACIEIFEENKNFDIKYIFDLKSTKKKFLGKYKVLNENNINKYNLKNCYGFVTVGQIKNHKLRKGLFNNLKKYNLKITIFKSNSSYVSKYSKIGDGTIIMNFVHIGPSSEIGKNCIINNNAHIEHDVKIHNHCHISTGAIINGNALIGEGTFIGSGTIVNNGISIGKGCIIASGLTISRDIKDNSLIK